MQKVLIFGGSGMLGSVVADCLSRSGELEVTATARDADFLRMAAERLPELRWVQADVRLWTKQDGVKPKFSDLKLYWAYH